MIWIIAGTKSARDLTSVLLRQHYTVLASTTTEYGKDLFEDHANLIVLAKPLNTVDMRKLVIKYSVKLIIDASHPYAEEVSNNAISTSIWASIPYIRYERRSLENTEINFDSYKEAAKYLEGKTGNILLTIGSKNLKSFSNIRTKAFARVLPFQSSLYCCEKTGFSPDRIIAMKFPFSKDFNKAMYKELNIKYLVTKDSGEEGGMKEKLEAACETGVEVICVSRPHIDYPDVKYSIDEIVTQAEKILNE